MKVKVTKIRPDIELPKYARLGDAGMDIKASDDTIIPKRSTQVVPTGLKFEIPQGYEIQIRPRSGLSLHSKLRIPNSPGTIDSGYRDAVGVIVENTSGEDIVIPRGFKIAQMVLKEVIEIDFEEVDELDMNNDRHGGFGSTGVI